MNCQLCGYDVGHGTTSVVYGQLYCEDCYNLALDCGYGEEDPDD